MKRALLRPLVMIVALIISTLFISNSASGQAASIWTNPITASDPSASNPFTSGDVNNSNIAVSGIGRGSGISGSSTSNRYNATGWTTSTSLSTTDYFTFTITPNAGYHINFSSFVYTGTASGNGPQNFAFRSNAAGNNFSNNIGTPNAGGTTISLTGTSYQNITSATEFRFYGYNGQSSGSSNQYSINDFTFNGGLLGTSVTSISGFTACLNTAGTAQSFTINAAGLSSASATMTVTGSTNYEVSVTSATSGFANSVTFNASGAAVSSKTVWVRLKSNAVAGNYNNENINISGGGFSIANAINVSCSGTVSALPTVSSAVKTSYNGADQSCSGANDGQITVTGSGGLAPLQYSKDNGSTYQASNVFSGLGAATYQIRIKDACNNISAATNVTIGAAPSAVTISGTVKASYNGADLSCAASSDGQITVTASGGTGTLQYSKDNGSTYQASNIFSGLAAGTYPIKVKDANNCTSTTTNVSITAPSAVTISGTVKANYNGADLSCAASNDGQITVTASGGTGTLQYSKDNGSTYQASNIFSGLAAGTYPIKVKDANNCTSTTTNVIITAPSVVTISGTMKASYNGADLSCATSTNGQITVTASGGTGVLQYSKDNGTAYQVSNVFSGLGAGTYQIKVKDANNCTSTVTNVTITAPATLSTSESHTTIACNGGSSTVTISAIGGTAPYTGTGNFTQSAGTQSYTVTDANGCTSSVSVTITEPTALSVSESHTAIACNGETSTVTISATGGTAPYTGTGNFTQSAGTQSYTMTDANGCTTSVSVTITEPAALSASESHTAIACNGGISTVTISATGGTAPYTGTGNFTQSPGTHNYIVTDANGCTSSVSITITEPAVLSASESHTTIACNGGTSTVTISATGGTAPYTGTGNFTQSAGTQSYTVTDANGCTSSVSVTITEPTALSVSESHTAILCNGGTSTVTINATGGTAPYTGTGNFTQSAGIHSYTVTDANGCTASVSVTITEPSALGGTLSSDNPVIACYGGTTTVTVTDGGGTTPYQYSIDGGLTFHPINAFTVLAGTYSVIIKDANGCTFTTNSITITQPASPLSGMIASQTDVSCFGQASGAVTVSASGGTAPYSYSINGVNYQSSASFTNLTAGTYTITIKDAHGCSETVPVSINEPTLLSISIGSQSNINCYGDNNGYVTVAGTGGVSPYSYSINGDPYQASGVYSNLVSGNYVVSVKDNNGCTASVNVSITGPSAALSGTASVSSSSLSCYNNTTAITTTASGGTAPYSYSLDGGTFQGSNVLTAGAGTHTVTIKDANGCTFTCNSITLTSPTQLVAASAAAPINCPNGTTVVTVSASGGTAPYTGTGNFTITAGTYTYTVTDANGCTAATTITRNNPPAVILTATDSIYGPLDVCPYVNAASTANFSVISVPNAIAYNWAGTTGITIVSGQGTNNVQVSFASGFTLGSISVLVVYPCGVSTSKTQVLGIVLPGTPAAVYGPTNVCNYIGSSETATYYTRATRNTNSYEWTVPAGATIVSGQGDTMIRVSFSNSFVTGQRVSVRSVSTCGNSSWRSSLPVVAPIPTTPGIISGPTDACPFVSIDSSAVYTIRKVATAQSYNWTAPAGAVIVSGQGDTLVRVKYLTGFTTGVLSVQSVGSCGTSIARTLSITRKLAGSPGAITGPTDACPLMGTPGTTTYTINPVINATSYLWTVPAGANIVSGQGTTSITVNYSNSFASGAIGVQALSNCNASATRSLNILKRVPTAPGAITGPTNACDYIGTSNTATYSIVAANYATSYVWTVPAGATLVSGQGTTSITVSYSNSFASGAVTVASVNNCSTSAVRTLSILRRTPATPGVITATILNCPSRDITYTVAPVNYASYYIWTKPANTVFVGDSTTSSVTISYPASAVTGSITVRAANNCAMSAARMIAVSVAACPPATTTRVVTNTPGDKKDAVDKNTDSVKNYYLNNDYTLIKQAAIDEPGGKEIPVIIYLESNGDYKFVFVPDPAATMSQVRLQNNEGYDINYQRRYQSKTDDFITLIYQPFIAANYVLQVKQEGADKAAKLKGTMLVFRKK